MSEFAGWPHWNATVEETQERYPSDSHYPDYYSVYRAVSIAAPAALVFRWLCQMKLAPYSYDWIDNFGKQSPQTLQEGVVPIKAGDRFMTIFALTEFEENAFLTIEMDGVAVRMFGDISCTYCLSARDEDTTRLKVKVRIRYPRGVLGFFMRGLLPVGDWIMMRKQLLTFKRLAEGAAMS